MWISKTKHSQVNETKMSESIIYNLIKLGRQKQREFNLWECESLTDLDKTKLIKPILIQCMLVILDSLCTLKMCYVIVRKKAFVKCNSEMQYSGKHQLNSFPCHLLLLYIIPVNLQIWASLWQVWCVLCVSRKVKFAII